MKLQEGQRYPVGFAVVLALWAVAGVLSSRFALPEPAFLGFAISVGCLVVYQAYSGVFLDRTWMASVSRAREPTWFWFLLLGQSAIAAFAFYFAFKR